MIFAFLDIIYVVSIFDLPVSLKIDLNLELEVNIF